MSERAYQLSRSAAGLPQDPLLRPEAVPDPDRIAEGVDVVRPYAPEPEDPKVLIENLLLPEWLRVMRAVRGLPRPLGPYPEPERVRARQQIREGLALADPATATRAKLALADVLEHDVLGFRADGTALRLVDAYRAALTEGDE